VMASRNSKSRVWQYSNTSSSVSRFSMARSS
jgi:hypothetical protein